MPDTQWPRFEVFKQDSPQEPFRSIGAIHAPDSEMALLNARDVHVRRPDCVGLWVVRADAIYSRTAEELVQTPEETAPLIADTDGAPQTYYVFQKTSQRRSMTFVTHVGEVIARTSHEALDKARVAFPAGDVFVWWVCPAAAITRSEPEWEDSWFAPAKEKTYRQQAFYHNVERKAQKG
ncbi:MAG: hypothetical protein MI924_24765 [Chloroflexales bacterium]|nr:hypothetical protein [Chloroflexales bacterium]